MTHHTIVVTTPPVAEAVSVADLKLHRRINGNAEDANMARFIATARSMFEFHSNGRIVNPTTFTEYHPTWPTDCRPIRLSRGPVTSIAGVKYYDQDDNLQTLSPSAYASDLTGVPALLWLKEGQFPALNTRRPRPVQVQYVAGFATCPDDVKTGILLLAAHYWEHRGDEEEELPEGFLRLAFKYDTGLDHI